MRSTTSSLVAADLAAIHSSIAVSDQVLPSLQPRTWQVLVDVAVDWTIIWLAVWSAFTIGKWAALIAVFVIGNRQRALGNLLHDAAHRNLSSRPSVNDRIAYLFLAPPLFNSLALYRHQHAKHHAWLGDPARDPDFIPRVVKNGDRWFHAYARVLKDRAAWAGSLFGHLLSRQLAARGRFGVLLWWATYEALLTAAVGIRLALVFALLWMIARATVFHAITTFREMTDHYGLDPRGIFRYTRDIPDRRPVSMLLHPHHNGYHLTHHLFPHIAYYHLPEVHARLQQLPPFARQAIVCQAYLGGTRAAVNGWGARHA
ncbi:MAG: fatty acid desaturase [Paraburkholderia sp.]|uniref:Fatty acid desaturase n=1 Tax=Paraburkholderia terricola TaxID=169427 RepID=A0A1M6J269_9BURK|nr:MULTISPECIES: fatty acid desaturase [Paraburkholderia]TAL93144.1 MAG: fatty acid desaturase [Paraburkholderia sp.]SDN48658.1 Fatty acid desaturase [Paraburkholderia sediminicola]SHJ40769.1 Fatty acid desaturase [Paraburkholderia terricola]